MAAPVAGEPPAEAVYTATFTRWEEGSDPDDTDDDRATTLCGVFLTVEEAARALARGLVDGRWVTRPLTAADRAEMAEAVADGISKERWFDDWNSEPWADEQVAAVRTLADVNAFIARCGPCWSRDRDLDSGFEVDIERMQLGVADLGWADCGNLDAHRERQRGCHHRDSWLPPWK